MQQYYFENFRKYISMPCFCCIHDCVRGLFGGEEGYLCVVHISFYFYFWRRRRLPMCSDFFFHLSVSRHKKICLFEYFFPIFYQSSNYCKYAFFYFFHRISFGPSGIISHGYSRRFVFFFPLLSGLKSCQSKNGLWHHSIHRIN